MNVRLLLMFKIVHNQIALPFRNIAGSRIGQITVTSLSILEQTLKTTHCFPSNYHYIEHSRNVTGKYKEHINIQRTSRPCARMSLTRYSAVICQLKEYVSCSNYPVCSGLLLMPMLYIWRSTVIAESIHEIHFKLMDWLAFVAIDTMAIMSFIDEFRLYCERGSGLL